MSLDKEPEKAPVDTRLHLRASILRGLRDAVFDLEVAAGLLEDINNAIRREI